MQENCQSGSEGGAKLTFVPTPILAQASAWVDYPTAGKPCKGGGMASEDDMEKKASK